MIGYTVKCKDSLTGDISYYEIKSDMFFMVGEKWKDEWGDEITVLAIGRNNWFA